MNRKQRVNNLYRIDRIELMIGKIILNIIASFIISILLLNIIAIAQKFLGWAEQSTLRYIITMLVIGYIAIRMLLKEIWNSTK